MHNLSLLLNSDTAAKAATCYGPIFETHIAKLVEELRSPPDVTQIATDRLAFKLKMLTLLGSEAKPFKKLVKTTLMDPSLKVQPWKFAFKVLQCISQANTAFSLSVLKNRESSSSQSSSSQTLSSLGRLEDAWRQMMRDQSRTAPELTRQLELETVSALLFLSQQPPSECLRISTESQTLATELLENQIEPFQEHASSLSNNWSLTYRVIQCMIRMSLPSYMAALTNHGDVLKEMLFARVSLLQDSPSR